MSIGDFSIQRQILNLFFPEYCVNCKEIGQILCNNCYEQCQFLTSLPEIRLEFNYLNELYSCFQYSGPIQKLIKAFKYQSVISAANLAGEIIYHNSSLPKASLITAVPLHHTRERERGFNQSIIIAKSLAKFAQLQFAEVLTRVVNSTHQASIKNKERRLTHLKNHFAIKSDFELSTFKRQPIIIVDDVFTTGATLNECAKTLKENDWSTVYGLTFAHG